MKIRTFFVSLGCCSCQFEAIVLQSLIMCNSFLLINFFNEDLKIISLWVDVFLSDVRLSFLCY